MRVMEVECLSGQGINKSKQKKRKSGEKSERRKEWGSIKCHLEVKLEKG